MTLYDWLLFLHVLSAFAVVAAQVVFTFVIVSARGREAVAEIGRALRLARPAVILVQIGAVGVLVFGLWLAIEDQGYEPWNGWIVAAVVMWLALAAVGRTTGSHYEAVGRRAGALLAEGRDGATAELRAMLRATRPFVLHGAALAIVLLLLIDMIYKPGA